MQDSRFIDFEDVGRTRERRPRRLPRTAGRTVAAGAVLAVVMAAGADANPAAVIARVQHVAGGILVSHRGAALQVRNRAATGTAATLRCANATAACVTLRNDRAAPAAAFSAPAGVAPFSVGGNATLVPGLNADLLDGRSADQIAAAAAQAAAGSRTPSGAAGGDLAGSYPSPTVADSAITTAKLADGAVTADKLAAGVVSATALGDASIGSGKLADGSVITAKLGDLAVATAKLADLSVTTGKLADNAVTGAKVAAGTLTDSDVAPANKDGAGGTPSLRTLGTGSSQAAAGNDARFPTTAQNAALAGTSGAPGSTNRYVTDADARLTNQRTPSDGSVTPAKLGVLPHGKAIATTAQTFPGNSSVSVRLNSAPFGSGVTFDDAGDVYRISTPGTYLISGEIVWSSNANGLRYLGIMVNGQEVAADIRAGAATSQAEPVTTVMELNANDTVGMAAEQGTGGNLATDPSFGRGAALEVAYLGPKA